MHVPVSHRLIHTTESRPFVRRSQRGGSSVSNLVALVIFAALLYMGARIGPYYLERYRLDSIAQKAVNQWMNTTPNLEEVKRDMQTGLDQAHISRVGATDFDFMRLSENEVLVTLEYTVTIRHPYNLLKPTPLNFKVEKRANRRFDVGQ